MLVEIAIADAYGAAFEYAQPTKSTPNDGKKYYRHPRHHEINPGYYTDDTQMQLAVARCLLSDSLSTYDFAVEFVKAFKEDPRVGYAGGFYKFLQNVKDGDDFLRNIKPDSDKSGGAMRAGVIGLLPEIAQVKLLASLQAKLTHNTEGGIKSAQAAALMVHHQAYSLGTTSDLPFFLQEHVRGVPWSLPWFGETTNKGVDIVHAAVTALGRSKTLTDVLVESVRIGGDVDTVATIAMACASVSENFTPDISQNLFNNLENNKFGKDYLAVLDVELSAKFNLPKISSKSVEHSRSI